MASIDWPIGLPKAADRTLNQGAYPSFVNDKAEEGAARRRAKFTRTLRTFSFSLHLNSDEKDQFDEFVFTTCNGGVELFNWQHPDTDVSYECRFVKLPEYRSRAPEAWSVTVQLEEV